MTAFDTAKSLQLDNIMLQDIMLNDIDQIANYLIG